MSERFGYSEYCSIFEKRSGHFDHHLFDSGNYYQVFGHEEIQITRRTVGITPSSRRPFGGPSYAEWESRRAQNRELLERCSLDDQLEIMVSLRNNGGR